MNTRVFIFGKLKEDFQILSKQILEEKPDFILGIAQTNKNSQFESKAINQFNKNKEIVKGAIKYLDLYIPKKAIFAVSSEPSDSFCNWTAYKIANFIKDNKLKTKMIFAHVKTEEIDLLLNSLGDLE